MSNVSMLASGNAEYVWFKKAIGKKDFKFYEDSPGYYSLYQNEGSRIVGFRRLVETNNPPPHHIDLCDSQEIESLEKKININLS